jgi:16S rRNA (guanine966-N2)-methyltransferase
MMRVVAGTARGRRLLAPSGEAVRPTTDRVREATCNALDSLGAIDGAEVLDLFAGSGALGIEALSRGARHCTFVEVSRDALDAIGRNLSSTGLGDRATVRRGDAFAVLAALAVPEGGAATPAVPEGGAATRAARPDLVLADPPYDFERWDELLDAVPPCTVVIESDRPVAPPEPWSVLRQRSYGTTVVTIIEHPSAGARPQDTQEGNDHP